MYATTKVYVEFQPFLRFWIIEKYQDKIREAVVFQPFLRFW